MQKLPLCSIYKSAKRDEMYLYVLKTEQLTRVPAALLEQFGTPSYVMDMLLKDSRKLARAETAVVLAAMEEKGFYLQLPPQKDDYVIQPKPGQFG